MPPHNYETVDDIRAYYVRNITNYGAEAPRTMGYHSAPIDSRLISNLLPPTVSNSYSVLDVGCGLAQLIPILAEAFPSTQLSRFVGLDLVEEFIQRSKQQFPQYEFHAANFMEWETTEKFDLVLAAGVLVTRIADYEAYLGKFVEKMVQVSKGWIGFNVIGSCGPSYTAKHLATITKEGLDTLLGKHTQVLWSVVGKEVFEGAMDTFVCGNLIRG